MHTSTGSFWSERLGTPHDLRACEVTLSQAGPASGKVLSCELAIQMPLDALAGGGATSASGAAITGSGRVGFLLHHVPSKATLNAKTRYRPARVMADLIYMATPVIPTSGSGATPVNRAASVCALVC